VTALFSVSCTSPLQLLLMRHIRQVDVVLEVRDARIPFSSANYELDRLIGGSKARLVVLNKEDLADPSLRTAVKDRLRAEVRRSSSSA
jgi:ribosome biogenesis GTPase A